MKAGEGRGRQRNAHGADERTPVEGYFGGLEFLYRLLKDLTE